MQNKYDKIYLNIKIFNMPDWRFLWKVTKSSRSALPDYGSAGLETCFADNFLPGSKVDLKHLHVPSEDLVPLPPCIPLEFSIKEPHEQKVAAALHNACLWKVNLVFERSS